MHERKMDKVDRISCAADERDPRRPQYSASGQPARRSGKHQEDACGASERIGNSCCDAERWIGGADILDLGIQYPGDEKSDISEHETHVVATARDPLEGLRVQ